MIKYKKRARQPAKSKPLQDITLGCCACSLKHYKMMPDIKALSSISTAICSTSISFPPRYDLPDHGSTKTYMSPKV